MSIVRRLLSMFAGGGRGHHTRAGGRGGLMSLASRFLGGSRGRRTTRF